MPSKPRKKQPVVEEPQPVDVVHVASSIKWVIGAVGAVLGLLVAWYIVQDRIDSHWRLETVQTVKDKEVEVKLRTLAQKAEVGRAWLFVAITDFKADWREQQADDCREQKKPNCARSESAALQARAEAQDAKRNAAAISNANVTQGDRP